MRWVCTLWMLAGACGVMAEEVRIGHRTFTLPEGFELSVAAATPLVDRPITIDFDERGRLYVAESSGSNDPVEQQLEEKPHRILRLEDSDGDGQFDSRTVFADRMMFPEGTLWHGGSLYVAAPPSIWKLTDTDADGVADRREEWFAGKTLTGCANDLHGPYLGPDGWIYWCKGAFAEQTYERSGREPLITRAAHIFRRRPEGGPIEPVMTGGMDNPVDVVFTPGGERVFTTTFLQHPGGGRRDGLIHAIYGGVYGKRHGVIDGHPRTGDLMPVLSHLGAAAPSGMVRLQADALGADYRHNLLTACFNLHSVKRHRLLPSGSTFRSRDEDLLVCDDLDFHPTDVIEDADGSVLIVDTGGWYKLCCPTSQLKKPDILGGIYRLRRRQMPQPIDPRGLLIAWKELTPDALATRLGDGRAQVRRRATQQLVARGAASVDALADLLRESRHSDVRRRAVWALCQIDEPLAEAALCTALRDSHAEVRQAAIHAVSVRRIQAAGPALRSLLKNSTLANRRASAEALGRLQDPDAIPALLAAVSSANDRSLDHSLIFALIEIADPAATQVAISHEKPNTRRAALIALDQMVNGQLTADDVCPLLASHDPVLRDTALFIAERHSEWGLEIASALRTRLLGQPPIAGQEAVLAEQLSRLARIPAVREFLGAEVLESDANLEIKLTVLRSLGKAELTSDAWMERVLRLLTHGDSQLVAAVVDFITPRPESQQKNARLSERLSELAHSHASDRTRLAAMQDLEQLDAELFSLATRKLHLDTPIAERTLAANAMSRAVLSARQREQLIDVLPSVGPMELTRILTVFEQPGDEQFGLRLVQALKQSSAVAALQPERVEGLVAAYGPAVSEAARDLTLSVTLTADDKAAKLDEYLQTLPDGDVRRGQRVFHSEQAACFACHAVGYRGGDVGPDLSRIARVRSRRDLLEAILFPSASFVRSFEPVKILTSAGTTFSGTIRDQNEDHILLQLDATEQRRISVAQVEELLPGRVSVMPAGLNQQLSTSQLADLLAFLESRK